jgi:hypothetical protein
MFLFSGISRLIPLNAAGGNLSCFVLGPGPVLLLLWSWDDAQIWREFAFRLLAGCWVFVCFNAAAEALSCTAYDLLNLVQCPL